MIGFPDPNRSYILYTDASQNSIGACLTQPFEDIDGIDPSFKNEKPIYNLSHKLSDAQTRRSTV